MASQALERGVSHFRGLERVGVEQFFWPNILDILRTHDTIVLRDRSLQVASVARHVNTRKIQKTMGVVEQAFSEKPGRKFTGDKEENHSLQVFLIAAEIIGLKKLTTPKAQIALGHNLFEDTSMPLEYMVGVSSEKVYSGIKVLSHKRNGITLYPDSPDKTDHLKDIVDAFAHEPHRSSELVPIKVADLIAVGNDPVTPQELIGQGLDEEIKQNWIDLSDNKQKEMIILKSLVPPEEVGIHRRLGEGIAVISLRQDPEAIEKLYEVAKIRGLDFEDLK